MSEDNVATPTVADSGSTELSTTESKPLIINPSSLPASAFPVPMMSWVKDGTTTTAGDNLIAKTEADAEKRRNEADREKQISKIPIEQGGGKQFTNHLTPYTDVPKAYIKLEYVNAKGEVLRECLADLVVGTDVTGTETDMSIILVCPKCEKKRPQGQCQIQVRQSNRKWYLDFKTAGEFFLFEEWDDESGRWVKNAYRSAGQICDSDKMTCPYCPWSFRIHKNKVYTDW